MKSKDINWPRSLKKPGTDVMTSVDTLDETEITSGPNESTGNGSSGYDSSDIMQCLKQSHFDCSDSD
jgi:hypothetical protein